VRTGDFPRAAGAVTAFGRPSFWLVKVGSATRMSPTTECVSGRGCDLRTDRLRWGTWWDFQPLIPSARWIMVVTWRKRGGERSAADSSAGGPDRRRRLARPTRTRRPLAQLESTRVLWAGFRDHRLAEITVEFPGGVNERSTCRPRSAVVRQRCGSAPARSVMTTAADPPTEPAARAAGWRWFRGEAPHREALDRHCRWPRLRARRGGPVRRRVAAGRSSSTSPTTSASTPFPPARSPPPSVSYPGA
jgi:hypothetical protein